MAWIYLYLAFLIIFLITSIVLKLRKISLISQNIFIIILKVLFIIPFIFLFFSSNFLNIFPKIKNLIEQPKKFQHVQIINDTKIPQCYVALKKHYLKNSWKFSNNLNSYINYSKIIEIKSKEKVDLLFEVDTNEFNRIAICKITKSIDFPLHSLILEVPVKKYILFASEFNPNQLNKIIRKDLYEDWLYSIYNLALFFLFIFIMVHLPSQNKIKFVYITLLVLIIIALGFLIYYDIIYLLNIYKII